MPSELEVVLQILANILRHGLTLGAMVSLGVIAVLYLLAKQPEVPERWAASLAKLLSRFHHGFKKSAIASDIRSHILTASRKIARLSPEALPYDLRVEWVEESDRDAFINGDQVIVCMSSDRNPQRNFVHAVQEYVAKGLMPKAKGYIDKKLVRATDLTIVRKILQEISDASLIFFNEQVLTPELASDEELESLIQELTRIDQNGMLVPILMSELIKASNRVYPGLPTPALVQESRDFVRFLFSVANRQMGEYHDTVFNRSYIKVEIALAANPVTYQSLGLGPTIHHIVNQVKQGIETVYIFGLANNIDIAKELETKLLKRNEMFVSAVRHLYTHVSVDGRKMKGICIRVDTHSASDSEQVS